MAERRKLLTGRQKILIGGLGALTPVVISLLAIDFETAFVGKSSAVILGYMFRVLLLFYLGGLVAYLHADEHVPLKIFELGIVAPALIMTMINAKNVEPPVRFEKVSQVSLADFFIAPAYAQTEKANQAELQQSSFIEQFLEGLTGSVSKKRYWVIVGWSRDSQGAKIIADEFNRTKPKFRSEVYKAQNGLYGVSIAGNLTYEAAQRIRKDALAVGFPSDTYIVGKQEEELPD